MTSWKKWAQSNNVQSNFIAKTGGGYHLYFRYPEERIASRAGLLPGVDVRADGGYVVAPGSLHHSGAVYTWVETENRELKSVPESLLQLLKNRNEFESQNALSVNQNSAGVLSGGRNMFLTRVGGLLRREGFDVDLINKTLTAINHQACSPTLPPSEVEQISKSIGRYATAWDEILKLETEPMQVAELDLSSLPTVMRDWVEDAAERMQVPPDFFAAPCLVSLAAVIGRQIQIFPKKEDSWCVIPNLWGAIIARPGLFKSPAIHESTSFIRKLAEQASRAYEVEKIAHEANCETLKSRIEGLKEAIKKASKEQKSDSEFARLKEQYMALSAELEETPNIERRFIVNDSTIEKLGSILQENPNGILLLRDELAGWAISLSKREGDREFYLESWNGNGSFTVDRIARGTNFIPNLCVSIFGGIQPSKLEVLSGNRSSGTDGLLQRFQLLVYPEVKKNWKHVDRKPREAGYQALQEVFNQAANLAPFLENSELRFSEEAQIGFNSWLETLEHRLRSGDIESEDFESHLSKYRSLLPSLAAIFEVAECLANKQKVKTIQTPSLEKALKWVQYLEQHALKVYRDDLCVMQNSALALGKKIIEGVIRDGDSVRSIYRHHWAGLSSPEQVQKALQRLEECSWAYAETVRNGPGQGVIIRINPKVYSFAKEQV